MLKKTICFRGNASGGGLRKRIGQRGGSCPGGTVQCDSAPSAPRHIYTNCTGEKSEERSEAKQGGNEGTSEDALRRCR